MQTRQAKASATPTRAASSTAPRPAAKPASSAASPRAASPRAASPRPGATTPARTTPAAGAGAAASPTSPRPAGGGGGGGATDPKLQAVKDRCIALFAAYEPAKVQHIEVLVRKQQGDPKKLEDFVHEYSKRHGPEPASKEAALRDFFAKHYKGDKKAVDSALKLIREMPGVEVSIFQELFANDPALAASAGAAGSPKRPPAATADSKAAASSPAGKAPAKRPTSPNAPSSPGSGALPASKSKAPLSGTSSPTSPTKRPASGSSSLSSPMSSPIRRLHEEEDMRPEGSLEDAETQTTREKSTCDPQIRDRVVAMLAAYDPDSLLVFDEDCDIPNTEIGNSFLNSLMEQHGPEPASKRHAVENLLRRLLEKQDPGRLRSLKTLVGAADAAGKEMQIVRAMFQAYGLTHRVGKSVPSMGLAPAVSTGAPMSFDFSSGGGGGGGGGMTSTTVLSPWLSTVSASPWSPDASLSSQRDLFANSPRRMPLRSKADLERELSASGVGMVQRPAKHQRAPSFSDLMVQDTFAGPVAAPRADDTIEQQIGHLNPFLAARGAPQVAQPRAAPDEESPPQSRDESENPFLKAGAKPRSGGAGIISSAVVFPKTPPQGDLALPF